MSSIDEHIDLVRALAIDEAMLLSAESGNDHGQRRSGVLSWFWSIDSWGVILGRSSKHREEINVAKCRDHGVDINRRCSGGATVMAGSGCLMYSLLIDLDRRPHLRMIDQMHRYVMQGLVDATRQQVPSATTQGTCDLTLNDQKFSGNALKIAKSHALYHGTVLHDFDMSLLNECLTGAPRQPDYRGSRDHRGFVGNVPIDPNAWADAVTSGFDADRCSAMVEADPEIVSERIRNRYGDPAWWQRR